jgi:hypothetical protein
MTTDNDIALQIRESVAELQMSTPVEAVLHAAAGRDDKRRAARAGVAIAAAAAAVFVAAGLTATHTSSPSAAPGAARLTAFTVTTGPAGSTALTLHKGKQYRLDPDALRRALADHGIPALVTVGKSCDTSPEPDGLDNVVTTRRQDDGNVFLTIDPAAMPAGAELSIGYFPSHTTFSLIEGNAPLRCSS